jgi:hypothetical protein
MLGMRLYSTYTILKLGQAYEKPCKDKFDPITDHVNPSWE